MPLELKFECALPNGMHARPASALEEAASRFVSSVALFNQRNGAEADAKSVLSVIAADVRPGDSCILVISGSDEIPAAEALNAFLTDILPHTDDVMPNEESKTPGQAPPACLRASAAGLYSGHGAVPGLGQGKLVMARVMDFTGDWVTAKSGDPAAEEAAILRAVETVTVEFERLASGKCSPTEKGMLQAHRAMARDPGLLRAILTFISEEGRSAAGAIAGAAEVFTERLSNSESSVIRERVLDVQDVCMKLLVEVRGGAAHEPRTILTEGSVVIAETLTPGQFLALDRTFLKGLVLTRTGATSHTVILARSFGIPTLTATNEGVGPHLAGMEAILDGDLGLLVLNPDEIALRYYQMERRRIDGRQAALAKYAAEPGHLADGRRMDVASNIASAEEAATAMAAGADGIGLLRTEMLFIDRENAPDEEEQFTAYRKALEATGNQPVIIRTIDIGGDKPVLHLDLPHEENPFLGCRGVRLYQKFESLIRTQIRAIVRASAHGKAWLLVPMIATVSEMRQMKAMVRGIQDECAASGIPFDAEMPIGAMIEVPAAAFAMDELAGEADFFSIGSNDLLQYFMAADRGNQAVAGLYQPLHPPFLRLLKSITSAARAKGRWIGLCGEMGGDFRCLPLLAGLGLDEISGAAPAIAWIKAHLSRLAPDACDALLENALKCGTAEEVEAMLAAFSGTHTGPLLAPELIVRDVDAATKEEAIKQAVDLLYIHGRTERPRILEEAVWDRENTYSTGFGHGFAVPHCKSDAVSTGSLAVLRLRQAVEWGSLDGQPVKTVILLVMREADASAEHMRVFSKLARSVMHAEFRERMKSEEDAEALCAFLKEKLEG